MATAERKQITALVYDTNKDIQEEVSEKAISDVLTDKNKVLWLDITAPDPEDIAVLAEEFDLHPLALHEMSHRRNRAACSEFDGLYVLVFYAANRIENDDVAMDASEDLRQIVIYLGKNFLITAHTEAMPEIDECVKRWKNNARLLPGDGVASPLYAVLDTLVDGYFPVLDKLADDVEDLEERIFAGGSQAPVQEIFRLKKEMLYLRKVLTGQRDALNLLLRQDIPMLPEGSLLFFQSVYDHLVRAIDTVDTYRDLLSSAMDMHLSLTSNRLNEVMKRMTAISAILMSAALVPSVYGMNFKHMPELEWQFGYPLAIGLMVLIGSLLVTFFKKIDWL